jgi:alkylresorcinol/alkylpyrone synthase
MSNVIAVGIAEVPYTLVQNDVKKYIHKLYAQAGIDIDRMIHVFDNSQVSLRHLTIPIEWLDEEHTFSERNDLYIKHALELSENITRKCLSNSSADPADINHIIFVSSTGIATPTIDALLFNKLGFNNHIKRTPIWGLGCAGGAAGLSRAMDYTRAFPKENVLLVCVELCSLTFQKDDVSKSNVIAASLFSDGAAAVLIAGDRSKLSRENKGIRLIDSLSTTYPDSLDVMGWDIVDNGFRVVFSRNIPAIVREYVYPNVRELLTKNGLSVKDIKHYITHPGGLKVIDAYEKSLNLTNGNLDYARKVLKDYGNMSSPSVLYVLNEFLSAGKYSSGELGLISALGPGFSSELLLFKCL